MNINQTWLQCINPKCAHKSDLLKERKFRCPECGSLYDIRHDFSLIPKKEKLIKLFDQRASQAIGNLDNNPLFFSGVWRFKEWIMPFLAEEDIVSLGEGICPLVKAGPNLKKWLGADLDLWILMEGMTPTGSFKDYGGTVLMSVARAAGIKAVACASTGDTSAMAAAYAARAGIKAAVILPKGKITSVQLAQPLAHGARIINVPGDFDDCMKIMEELVQEFGVYPANSLNPARIEGHQASVFQIVQALGWQLPDWIAVPVGNGSNCSSIGKGLRLLEDFGFGKKTRILASQSRAADPLAESWQKACSKYRGQEYQAGFIENWQKIFKPKKAGETTATAARIGAPVSRDKVMREIAHSRGAMQIASERDLNEAVEAVGKDGQFVCPQTGIALAGLRSAIQNNWIKKDAKVIVISTATGLKFTQAIAQKLEKKIINLKSLKAKEAARALGF